MPASGTSNLAPASRFDFKGTPEAKTDIITNEKVNDEQQRADVGEP